MRQTYLSWDYRGALSADMRVSFQADVILRSATRHHLTVPRYQLSTFGRRAFSVAGPTVWNSLLDSLCYPALTSNSFRVQTIAENEPISSLPLSTHNAVEMVHDSVLYKSIIDILTFHWNSKMSVLIIESTTFSYTLCPGKRDHCSLIAHFTQPAQHGLSVV